jgi:YgiT-type zinc finger domain-containing protein
MVSRCYLCGGKTEHRLITAENWRGEELALVEQVPAWVCQDCGETYFEAETCRQLDRLCQAPTPPWKIVQVPGYTFTEPE